MTASRNSAFYWQGEPSIFATDRAFTAQGDKGRSLGQSAADRHAGLRDADARKGGISIGERDQDTAAKRTRLMRSAI